MPVLTADQVYAQARATGLSRSKAIIATAIAFGESGFKTTAIGDTTIQTGTWGPSVGLWQVRSLKNVSGASGSDRYRDASKLTDPQYNAAAMYAISSKGTNWKPWSVYTSGTYKKFLGQATAAADRVEGGAARMPSGSGPQAFALAEHNSPSKSWLNRCQEFVRKALGLPGGAASAADAYQQAKARGAIRTDRNPPANVPVFYNTGKPAGHVGLSDGRGNVWSTDIRRKGQVDLVPIAEIEKKWGATYLGWGTYMNGQAIDPSKASSIGYNPLDPIPGLNQLDDLDDHVGAVAGALLDWGALQNFATKTAFVGFGLILVVAGAYSLSRVPTKAVGRKVAESGAAS